MNFMITIVKLNTIVLPTDFVSSVLGVTGGKVALPCNITPPTYDDAVSLILWYKDESTTPIYRSDSHTIYSIYMFYKIVVN